MTEFEQFKAWTERELLKQRECAKTRDEMLKGCGLCYGALMYLTEQNKIDYNEACMWWDTIREEFWNGLFGKAYREAMARKMNDLVISLGDEEIYEYWINCVPDEATDEDFEWIGEEIDNYLDTKGFFRELCKNYKVEVPTNFWI